MGRYITAEMRHAAAIDISNAELGRNEVNAAADLSLYGKKPDASINVAMRWHLREEDGRRRFFI